MTNTYDLRYGTLDEIVKKEGELVKTVEDLYCSSKKAPLIFIPKVVGVYQEEELDMNIALAQEALMKMHQTLDKENPIDHSLISIVYDPEVINSQIIRDSLRGSSGRIKICDYTQMPFFEGKEFPGMERMMDTLVGKDEQKKKDLLNELVSLRKNYGLTKIEEIQYDHVRRRITNPS